MLLFEKFNIARGPLLVFMRIAVKLSGDVVCGRHSLAAGSGDSTFESLPYRVEAEPSWERLITLHFLTTSMYITST